MTIPWIILLTMLTGGQPLDAPEVLPPIGASVSLNEGAIHASLFVPAPLIKLSLEMIQRVAANAEQP